MKKNLIIFISICSFLVVLFLTDMCIINTKQNNSLSDAREIYHENVENYKELIIGELIEKFNRKLDFNTKNTIVTVIIEESNRTGIDPFLIASIIAVESSFKPNAISTRQAKGLMQISQNVVKLMNLTDAYDIKSNIFGGSNYLKILYEQFGSEKLVLAAYNAGPTIVKKLKRVPNYRETVQYIEKVNSIKEHMNQMIKLKIKYYLDQAVAFTVMDISM